MQNDLSGATAEGMSTASRANAMTRRLFLGRAAALAPLAAMPALAAPMAQGRGENPALLALLPEIKRAWQAFTIAECDYQRAKKAGRELWPRAPRIIKEERLTSGGDIERDIEGAGFGGGGYISTTAFIARALDAHRGVKGMAAKRRALRAEMAAARDYETACEAARTVSGFSAARAERVAAIKGLEALVRQAASESAHTMEGVKVKAEAIMLWNDVPFVFRVDEMMNGSSSLNLAASILDILEPVA